MSRQRFVRVVGALVLLAALATAANPFDGAGAETTRSTSAAPTRAAMPIAQPTERGAVQTATAFLSSMTLTTLLDPRRRRSILAVYAEPSARPGLEQLYDREHDRVASSYRRPPRVARAALLGYRVDDFNPRVATVSLWAATIGGSGSYAPTTGWSTTTVDLAWSTKGWRVTGVKDEPGPSADWPIGSLASEAKTFRPFDHAP
jgi:hypothetical protein